MIVNLLISSGSNFISPLNQVFTKEYFDQVCLEINSNLYGSFIGKGVFINKSIKNLLVIETVPLNITEDQAHTIKTFVYALELKGTRYSYRGWKFWNKNVDYTQNFSSYSSVDIILKAFIEAGIVNATNMPVKSLTVTELRNLLHYAL
jgi:hypothetical protein